jgi:hypothetical protein
LLEDHFTKRIWARSIPSKHTSHVVSMLEDTFQSIGLKALQGEETPKFTCFLRSDNGGEFVSKDVKETCKRYTQFCLLTHLGMEL